MDIASNEFDPTRISLPGTPNLLVVADEWFSVHGGISTLNRHLCGGLAATGATVSCLVLSASLTEHDDAAQRGVRLIGARPIAGAPALVALMQKPELPLGGVPDVIIGHGRVTGVAAKFLAENHFPGAARLHFVHVAPDEVEWLRVDRADDAGERAAQRVAVDLELGRTATRVVAVGPSLHRRLERDLHGLVDVVPPLRFDPGFDGIDNRPRLPAPGGPQQVLVLGRMEDAEIKGVDLAAAITARAVDLLGRDSNDVELLVRGAPPGDCARLRDRLRAHAADRALHITVRPFTTDDGTLQQDLARAHLVLMPSRAEGFGLAGAEAIASGVPTLVSDRSGLGRLLRETLPPDAAARVVVPVTLDETRDVTRWATHAAAILRHPDAAFTDAHAVRQAAARKSTWANATAQLLRAVLEPTPSTVD